MKFKVGDKVKVVKTKHPNKKEYIGRILTITHIDERYLFPYEVSETSWIWCDTELKLVEAEFIKADLKDGMVVEYRDSSRRMVLGDKLFGHNLSSSLDNFTDTLEPFDSHLSNMITIDKVYKSKGVTLEEYFITKNLTLIWERPKEEPVKEMTVTEIEKELGYKIKVIGEE